MPVIMNTYLGFAYKGAETPQENAFAEGERLAVSCCSQLQKLGEKTQFPPKLLVLLATSKYLEGSRANDLVPGIITYFNSHFEEPVPLIGSSVAAVSFDQKVYEHGAVLICLASKLLEVKVGATTELLDSDTQGVEELLEGLELSIAKGQDPNPQQNRELLVFLPGQTDRWRPSRLCNDISEGIGYRLPITGGVSHPITQNGDPGLQFTEFGVQRGAIVAARLQFQVPIASRLARSLNGTGEHVIYEKIAGYSFNQQSTAVRDEIQSKGFALLGKKVDERHVAMVVLGPDGCVNRELIDVEEKERLELLAVKPKTIEDEIARVSLEEPMRWIQLENPAGCITFRCASCYSYRKRIGLDLEKMFTGMQEVLHGAPVVGGFFDGEMGVDHTGRSMFANWAGAVLTIGDEMSEQAIWQRGLEAIADNIELLNQASSVPDLIRLSLNMISAAGYPGALISLLLPGPEGDWIIAQEGRGRFQKIAGSFQSRWSDEKELAAIAKEERAERGKINKLRYLPDCRTSAPEKQPLWQHEIISQYVIPLYGPSDDASRNLLGFIHIDLGDSSKKQELRDTTRHVLDSLGAAVESSLVRVLAEEEARIMRALDMGMSQALLASSVDEGRQIFVSAAVESFGTISGYVRILQEHSLHIVAGVGSYYEAIQKPRARIDSTDQSLCGEAFVRGESRIINDAKQDPVYRRFCHRFPDRPDQDEEINRMMAEVNKAGAFMVSVLKNNMGRKTGTIIFVSQERWPFHNFHMRCLMVLGERLRPLIEHLEKTGPADFLRLVGQGLPASAYIPALEPPLELLTKNFCEASNAQVACVFLWDESFQKFVLHAQNGWRDAGWEFAAYYEKHEGWTGSVAMEDEPRYSADMVDHKKRIGSLPRGVYEVAMFGEPNGQITEGLGLPLKAGSKRLGVLTAFRRYTPSPLRSNFLTRDQETLKKAANRISDYISSLLLQKAERLQKEKSERLEGRIYTELQRAGEQGPIPVLCRILPRVYKAEKVFFYVPGETGELECKGYSHDEQPPDEIVERVSRDLIMDIDKTPNDPDERHTPAKAATHGALRRACIPIAQADHLFGVLDIYWPEQQTRQEQPVQEQLVQEQPAKSDEFRILSVIIRSVYQRYLIARDKGDAEKKLAAFETRSGNIVSAMVAPAKQALNRCNNIDPLLEGLENLIKAGKEQDKLLSRIHEIRFQTRHLPRAMQLLKAGPNPARAAERVDSLLQDAISEFDWGEIKCVCNVPETLKVNVNRVWIVEVFYNILDNAIRAIYDKGETGTVAVSATTIGNEVHIIFKDTGIGMTKAEIDMLQLPHGSSKPFRASIGTSLTRALLEQQGGKFSVQSLKGFGTEITVELPQLEKALCQQTA